MSHDRGCGDTSVDPRVIAVVPRVQGVVPKGLGVVPTGLGVVPRVLGVIPRVLGVCSSRGAPMFARGVRRNLLTWASSNLASQMAHARSR